MKTFMKIIIPVFIIYISININFVNAEEDEWNQYRNNSKNNPVIKNYSLSNQFIDVLNTNNEIRSTPVISGENIYIGNHESGNISAYNLVTGELLWENQAPNWIHSEIIHTNNQLFVGYGNRFMQENGI